MAHKVHCLMGTCKFGAWVPNSEVRVHMLKLGWKSAGGRGWICPRCQGKRQWKPRERKQEFDDSKAR